MIDLRKEGLEGISEIIKSAMDGEFEIISLYKIPDLFEAPGFISDFPERNAGAVKSLIDHELEFVHELISLPDIEFTGKNAGITPHLGVGFTGGQMHRVRLGVREGGRHGVKISGRRENGMGAIAKNM